MSAKTKKGTSAWFKCEKCQANLVQKDIEIHNNNCPPSIETFVHPYVWRGNLNGPLEIKANEEIKGLDYHDKNNLIFISQSAIQLCSLVIGEWALVKTSNSCVTPCAKIVWPTIEKSLGSILITQNAFDSYWKGKPDVKVAITKLNTEGIKVAKQIILIALNSPKTLQLTPELILRIKKLHMNRFVSEHNKLNCMFYGKNLEFLINEIESSETEIAEHTSSNSVKNLESDFENLNLSEDCNFYQITNSTAFKLFGNENDLIKIKSNINPLLSIGGLDLEISEIQDLVDVALGRVTVIPGLKLTRGILLYGSSGTGKSMVSNAIAEMSRCRIISINGPDLYSKYAGETEITINNLFKEAIVYSPSIILLDEMDILCPIRTSRITEQEKRVVSTVLVQLDNLHNSDNSKVCVIATSSRPDYIDPAFRRCGRIDREIEIPIPNPQGRLQILKKLISRTDHNISDYDLKDIANSAHGYVGSDLASLCSRAAMHAMKRSISSSMELHLEDLRYALTRVRPSAMREVQIEVPDVKWSDIGGQSNLKLILKQAVEWPLKYAESFVRMGITPPKGVLMFGPPGCSKTMIAKALATESGLNFLSIKGPELFSKWVGESERAVREVFRKARQVAPSVVFFDEIDALGGERGGGSSNGGTNVQERVLAQLLTELDGVTPLGEVTVLAATNRPDRIDKALLRPGRLDRIVYVPLPDDATRKEIFDLKMSKMPIQNVNVNALVELTKGYSGAEIQAVCHEAAMNALENDIEATSVSWEHFQKSLKIITPRTSPSLLKIYEEYIRNK